MPRCGPTAKRWVVDGHELVLDYLAPRITSEVYECGLPLTFDQYNKCAFNCRYCFAAFIDTGVAASIATVQSVNGKAASKYRQPVRGVDPARFRRYWAGAQGEWSKTDQLIANLLKKRTPLHWGGLSDPFCPFEKRFKLGVELLTFLRGIDWPVVFSTKGKLMTEEPWASLIAGGDFRFQFSITCLDAEKSKYSEGGVGDPMDRFESMRIATKEMGCGSILRLRPIIPGYADVEECVHMIELAAKAGATGVSTEFFCLEARGTANRSKYEYMSRPIGFDLYDFYRRNSPGQSGYLRLSRPLKAQWFLPMAEAARKLGMRFSVSDMHFKELGTSDGCCAAYSNDESINGYDGRPGVHINRGTNTYALIYARDHGTVRWSDIAEHLDWADELMNCQVQGIMCTNKKRSRHRAQTLKEALHSWFNDPNHSKSPYRYSGGKVVPTVLDEHGDMIYEYVEGDYDEDARVAYGACTGCSSGGGTLPDDEEMPDVAIGDLVR